MLTLFKSLVISRLDYASQLLPPHKISQITQIEKVQRSFTKHITGMRDLSYHERLQALRLARAPLESGIDKLFLEIIRFYVDKFNVFLLC